MYNRLWNRWIVLQHYRGLHPHHVQLQPARHLRRLRPADQARHLRLRQQLHPDPDQVDRVDPGPGLQLTSSPDQHAASYKVSEGILNNGNSLVWILISLFFRSYFHPANLNNSSEQLHIFIASLCSHFIDRLHLERYNQKWPTKTPADKRLRECDVTEVIQQSILSHSQC